MMKHEFENMTNTDVDQETYERIETVYMYYPGIETKDQIVSLYKIGMVAINDLYRRADELKTIETDIANLQKRASHLRE